LKHFILDECDKMLELLGEYLVMVFWCKCWVVHLGI
jgi:hypothetical protein